MVESKLAVLAIIVENADAVQKVNGLLHEFGDYILGRMGLPCKQRGLSVISIIIDAPMQTINSLSGKLGMIDGVSSKTLTAR
jgi:putative iron-only hydrogenase system regulator